MPVRMNTSQVSSGYIQERRPTTLTRCQKCRLFCYNKDEKKFLGKTGPQWGKLLLFYIIFIALIAAVFVIFMVIYLQILSKKVAWRSKADLESPLEPGISFFPNVAHLKSPLIYYDWNTKEKKHKSYSAYVDDINSKLQLYKDLETKTNNCSNGVNRPCKFELKSLGPCGIKGDDEYGYKTSTPCIYVKLNNIDGWTPQYYDTSNLPDTIPPELAEKIKSEIDKESVWIYCEGLHNNDKEHVGNITYYPGESIQGYYFPFSTNDVYLSPLVAIKLNELDRGFLVTLRCSAYAKNLNPNGERSRIEIQVYIPLNLS